MTWCATRRCCPLRGGKADEGALISLTDYRIQVLEKPYALSDSRRCYFAGDLLGCRPRPSTRELIKVLDQTAVQVNADLSEPVENLAPVLKNALYQIAEQGEEAPLSQIADEVFQENVHAREVFCGELEKSGVPEKIRIPQPQAQRLLSKQKISTDIGIDINLPVEFYNDTSKIEFISQPDGTLSILIKGIGKMTNR